MEIEFENDIREHHPRQEAYPNLRIGGPGNHKGTPNRLTKKGREAIVDFVVDNAGRMQAWLDDIASGYKIITYDKSGNEVTQMVPPNPIEAAKIYQAMVEYYIPKLQRTEIRASVNHTGDYEMKAKTAEEAAREYQELLQ